MRKKGKIKVYLKKNDEINWFINYESLMFVY